jgi:hypothetical protein
MAMRRLEMWMAFLAMAAGCAGNGASSQLTAAGPTSAEAGRCGRWVIGAAAVTAEQRVVILGGGQGTAEAPRFAAELTCQLGKGRPVVLALPWPRNLASSINLYLGGSPSAEERLRAHPLWTFQGTIDAGLANTATWEMLVQLRAWRAAGLEVKVFPFGAEFTEEGGYDESTEPYERYYQTNALEEELRKNGDAVFVWWVAPAAASRTAKLGNEASLTGSFNERKLKLATFVLEEPAAGVANVAGAGVQAPWSMERRAGLDGYDGVFRIGATTKSPPLAEPPKI